MLKTTRFVLSSFILLIVLSACGGPNMPLDLKDATGTTGGGSSGSTVNYNDNIKPLFQTKCTACHGPGKMNPKDWTDYATAFANKALIYQRIVVLQTMPMGGALPATERDLVAAWVDAGAPESAPAGQPPASNPPANPPVNNPPAPPVNNPPAPPAGVNYLNNIQPLFMAKCTACHGPGKMNPKDWTDYQTALANKDLIFQRIVVTKTMPMGGALPDPEVALVSAWITAGAPLDGPGAPPAPGPAPSPDPVPGPQPPSDQPPPLPPSPPTAGLTYTKDIRPLLAKNCGVCHFAGGPFPNWQDYNVAFSFKDKILKRAVIEKSMPQAGVGNMTDAERKLLGDWITTGAVE